jgi:predicted Zn-dependent peptidase
VLKAVRRTLPNGLRVVVLNLPHLHAVSHALLVRCGPRHETVETNGISHLVEHLLFRGTERHPESFTLNAAIEALGGEVNGLTQRDATTIHMTVPPRTAVAGLELLGELCTEPVMGGIEIERNVVIEEILDTTDGRGVETDIDTISRQVMWAGHPLSMPVAGTADNVKRFSRAQCRAHYERTFTGANGVLCVAGPVDEDAIFAAAERSFSLPRGRQLLDGPAAAPSPGLPIHIQETEDSQVSVLLSFPAPHEHDPRFVPMLLLRRILDDGLSSRLRQAVCERRGLAYSLSASVDAYADAAIFDLDASCAPKKLVPIVTQMLEVLEELSAQGVEADELERVKTRHQAELEFVLDDPSELCGWYGAAELIGSRAGFGERLSEALAVRPAELTALARSVFSRARALLTLVGPADPAAVAKLERVLGRPAGSSVWLNDEGRNKRRRLRIASAG